MLVVRTPETQSFSLSKTNNMGVYLGVPYVIIYLSSTSTTSSSSQPWKAMVHFTPKLHFCSFYVVSSLSLVVEIFLSVFELSSELLKRMCVICVWGTRQVQFSHSTIFSASPNKKYL